jgi:hypothetical protein
MKIYRMIPDYARCLHLDPGLFPGRDDLGNTMLRSEPLIQKWKTLKVTRRATSAKTRSDFVMTSWSYAEFGVNARAMEVLRPHVEGSCEFLPIQYRNTMYWILYVRDAADCLDTQRTIFNGADENPRDVQVPAFIRERLPNHALFRISRGFDYYVTEELKGVIEKAKLTGVRIHFVWSDDGSEPEETVEQLPRKRKPGRKGARKRVHSRTERDLLLERFWQEVILPRGDESWLDRELAATRLKRERDRYDAARAARKLIKLGASKEDILDLMLSLAYEVAFEVLVAIEEECLDKSPALESLHEDLLMAEPD